VKGEDAGSMYEIGHHHYHVRCGLGLPFTGKLLPAIRPTMGAYMTIFETLTHGSSTAASRCKPTADTTLASV
jgi:hypothetical protein